MRGRRVQRARLPVDRLGWGELSRRPTVSGSDRSGRSAGSAPSGPLPADRTTGPGGCARCDAGVRRGNGCRRPPCGPARFECWTAQALRASKRPGRRRPGLAIVDSSYVGRTRSHEALYARGPPLARGTSGSASVSRSSDKRCGSGRVPVGAPWLRVAEPYGQGSGQLLKNAVVQQGALLGFTWGYAFFTGSQVFFNVALQWCSLSMSVIRSSDRQSRHSRQSVRGVDGLGKA